MSTPVPLLPAAAPTVPLRRIGPYRVERQLATGGRGVVFRAFDERLWRPVAIKQILSARAGNTFARARFRRQARTVAHLNHRAIVQTYDILEEEDGDWIVMELVKGRSIAALVEKGPLAVEKVIDLAWQIIAGLAAAHAKGMVHRDLKAENVLVTFRGYVKILDFGLAKQWGGDGALIGTCRAMAPEQAKAQPVDHRTDFFALGVLLYEMLTGSSPFLGASTYETLSRVVNQRQIPVRKRNPQVSERLSCFVDTLLEKEPESRPQDAAAILQALAEVSGQGVDDFTAFGLPKLETVPPRYGTALARPDPTSNSQATRNTQSAAIVRRTLLCLELVARSAWMEALGEHRASGVVARHDHLVCGLIKELGGHEVGKAEDSTLVFDRPIDAVVWAVRYHEALAQLSAELGGTVQGRVGIHVAEVFRRQSMPKMVVQGAKPALEEEPAQPAAARLMTISRPGQTLLSQEAYELARHASRDDLVPDKALRWVDHGIYRWCRTEEDMHVFEVGRVDAAPLAAPQSTTEVHRAGRRLPSAAVVLVLLVLLFAIVGLMYGFLARGSFGTAVSSGGRLVIDASLCADLHRDGDWCRAGS